MSPYKSSSSLQNSVYSWSFSKSGRFDGLYKKPISDSIYCIPDGKNSRCASQGFGKRIEIKNRAGQNSPAPNTYKIISCFDSSVEHKKGAVLLEKYPPIVLNLLMQNIFFSYLKILMFSFNILRKTALSYYNIANLIFY